MVSGSGNSVSTDGASCPVALGGPGEDFYGVVGRTLARKYVRCNKTLLRCACEREGRKEGRKAGAHVKTQAAVFCKAVFRSFDLRTLFIFLTNIIYFPIFILFLLSERIYGLLAGNATCLAQYLHDESRAKGTSANVCSRTPATCRQYTASNGRISASAPGLTPLSLRKTLVADLLLLHRESASSPRFFNSVLEFEKFCKKAGQSFGHNSNEFVHSKPLACTYY